MASTLFNRIHSSKKQQRLKARVVSVTALTYIYNKSHKHFQNQKRRFRHIFLSMQHVFSRIAMNHTAHEPIKLTIFFEIRTMYYSLTSPESLKKIISKGFLACWIAWAIVNFFEVTENRSGSFSEDEWRDRRTSSFPAYFYFFDNIFWSFP